MQIARPRARERISGGHSGVVPNMSLDPVTQDQQPVKPIGVANPRRTRL